MIGHFLLLSFLAAFCYVECNIYDDGVKMTVSLNTKSVVWNHKNTTLTSLGCEKTGKFVIFTHGWMDSAGEWIPRLNQQFLKYRKGCVIFLDWGEFAKDTDYNKVTLNYLPHVSEFLRRKLDQIAAEGILPQNIYLYGHSLGARLVVDAAFNFGQNRIGNIDVCDPAGSGFYFYDAYIDAKKAAKNVQGIFTSSTFLGTYTRNCHQNFIMGNCGLSQPASKGILYWCRLMNTCSAFTSEDELSHKLCNEFYINSFENNFVAKNANNCEGCVNVATLPAGYKMGYDDSRNSSVQGIIPVPTSVIAPYNVL